MKIESVRGYIEAHEWGTPGRVTLHKEPNPSRVAVAVHLLDSESVEATREKAGAALAHLMHRECWTDRAVADIILAAIGITEEER